MLLYQSVASALLRHTSEVKFTFFHRVQIGERVVDEVCREPHGGELWLSEFCFLSVRLSCMYFVVVVCIEVSSSLKYFWRSSLDWLAVFSLVVHRHCRDTPLTQ